VTAFPWSNLITAVGTLGAALGAVGLKNRSDRKDRAAQADREDDSARAERLRLAYADLVTTATEMLRHLEQGLNMISEVTQRHPAYQEHAKRGEQIGGQLARAITTAQLLGSSEARQAARAVHVAAGAASKAVVQENLDRAAAEAANLGLFHAIDAFIDAVRPETTALASRARPPRPARRWWPFGRR
jgi:hypothetical protein